MYDGLTTSTFPTRRASPQEVAWEKLLLEIVEAVSVPASDYERIESHYNAISEILIEPDDPELADGHVFPQGSFLTRTVVRALGKGEIDVDAILLLQETALTPRALLETLHAELEARARTQGGVERRNRCVTVHYADASLPAHLDVTPAIASNGNNDDEGWGPLEVPDYKQADWHPTNPRDFADWFNDISETPILLEQGTVSFTEARKRADAEQLPSHEAINAFDPLRATVKLMKRHRDVFRERHGAEAPVPISVVITTLAAKAYKEVAELSQKQPLTALQAIREIITRMPNQFDEDGRTGSEWRLCNPRRRAENFAEKWNRDPAYAALFNKWHGELASAVGLGFAAFSEERAFEEEVLAAFGPEARKQTRSFLLEEAGLGHPLPGLDDTTAERLRKAGVVGATFRGLGDAEPRQAAQPKSLGRLG